MRSRWIEHDMYKKLLWDLPEESIGSTYREDKIYLKGAWDLYEKIIMKAEDLPQEIIKSTWREHGSI